MRKERDVITCVDLPQLEDKGWRVSQAVMSMLIGVRFLASTTPLPP